MSVPAGPNSATYCKRCFYDLRGLEEQRCPECGLVFDLSNPSTFSRVSKPEHLKKVLSRATNGLHEVAGALMPHDPTPGRIATMARRIAELTAENQRLSENLVWLLGLLMEKGIVTESDLSARIEEESAANPTPNIDIVDDTPAEEESEPTPELMELERAVFQHDQASRSHADPNP